MSDRREVCFVSNYVFRDIYYRVINSEHTEPCVRSMCSCHLSTAVHIVVTSIGHCVSNKSCIQTVSQAFHSGRDRPRTQRSHNLSPVAANDMSWNGLEFLKSDLGYGKAMKVIFGVLSLPSFTPQIILSLADRRFRARHLLKLQTKGSTMLVMPWGVLGKCGA